jgi:hypothetical protein
MMQIWWELGRATGDSMFFQALYGLGSNITLLDAAQQYIKADSILFDGRYHCIVTNVFNQHGLAYDATCAGEYPLGTIDIILYDISGRQLATYQNATSEIKPDLPAGVYIIRVSAQGYQQGFKWVNLR